MLQVERDTRILAPDLSSNQSQVTVNATSLYLQTDKALNLLPDHQPEIGHLQPKMLDYSKSALTVSSVFMGVLIDCGVHVCGERGEGGGVIPRVPMLLVKYMTMSRVFFFFRQEMPTRGGWRNSKRVNPRGDRTTTLGPTTPETTTLGTITPTRKLLAGGQLS